MGYRIRRIATVRTFTKYKADLQRIAKAMIKKSKTDEDSCSIVNSIFFGCYNPYFFSAIIEKDDKAMGLITALVQPIPGTNKKVFIDHFSLPYSKAGSMQVYRAVQEKLMEEHGVQKKDFVFLTHRNPDAWIRGAKKLGVNFKTISYILQEEE